MTMKIIIRELYRIGLIVFAPVLFPIWILFVHKEGWSAVFYYWKSVFKKDLNSTYFDGNDYD